MSATAKIKSDLEKSFDRFFVVSDHTFCLWDDCSHTIIKVNPAFERNYVKKVVEGKSETSSMDDFILKNKLELKQTIIEDRILLLECDKILFQDYQQNKNDFERLNEERIVANVQAEELGEKLSQSQKQFHKIAKIAPTGILFTDSNFKITWSNDKGYDLFGSKAIINQSLGDLIYLKQSLKFYQDLDKLSQTDKPIQFKFTIHNQEDKKQYFITCHGVSLVGTGLERTFIFILEDHTENTYYSEEITRRNLELTQINNELDKFLYSVSHNIRGPVASLQGLLNVIDVVNADSVDDLKHHLRLNLRLLNSFVEDIQNVSTNLHTHTQNQEVKLIPLIDEIISFLTDIYKVKPHVKLNIPVDCSIFTDFDRLNIVFKNVLKNSFLYRDNEKSKFEIIINAEQMDKYLCLDIFDNGTGIEKKVLPKVFHMFYRGSELSSGNGLGLYNSREILKKIGGRINIESQYRHYTSVKIYLPINSK